MNLIKHSELTAQGLRYFGGSMVAMLAFIAGAIAWRWDQGTVACWVLAGDLVFAIVYFGFPMTQKPIHDAFVRVTSPIQWLMSYVILVVVFFAVFLPVGIGMRLFRHSIRRVNPEATSHWVKRENQPEPKRYYDAY
ncbi:MAG: hypothetical protein WBD31_05870 [Rubripirellula sp.]